MVSSVLLPMHYAWNSAGLEFGMTGVNNVHMTTEKIQISAAQTRICRDHRAEVEDIKTRATISWIIEPLSKLRI